jgi:sulfur carrier protein
VLTIFLNGEERTIDRPVNIDRLLEMFSLPSKRIAIEINTSVVRRKDWENTPVNEGDRIEVVHFVGGG